MSTKFELRITAGKPGKSGKPLFNVAIIGEKNALGIWDENPAAGAHYVVSQFFKVNPTELEIVRDQALALSNERETEQPLENKPHLQLQQK